MLNSQCLFVVVQPLPNAARLTLLQSVQNMLTPAHEGKLSRIHPFSAVSAFNIETHRIQFHQHMFIEMLHKIPPFLGFYFMQNCQKIPSLIQGIF